MLKSVDASGKRRYTYRRAQTISSLPTELIPEVDNERDEEEAHLNECSKFVQEPTFISGIESLESSPLHKPSTSYIAAEVGAGVEDALHVCRQDQLGIVKQMTKVSRYDVDKKSDIKLARKRDETERRKDYLKLEHEPGTLSLPGQISVSGKLRAKAFQKRRSITITTDEPLLPNFENERIKSSSSSILSKFKERIQQSLFNSSEWPHAAAMIQERRERANLYVKKTLRQKELDLDQIQLTELNRRTTSRRKRALSPNSDKATKVEARGAGFSTTAQIDTNIEDDTLSPEIEAANARAAKEAFRRRSISEDIYDRLPPTYIVERHAITASANECLQSDMSSRSSSGGIVCSDDDLHFILSSYKREKSHSPRHNVAQSDADAVIDCANPHPSYATQVSCPPRIEKIHSFPQMCEVLQTEHPNTTQYQSDRRKVDVTGSITKTNITKSNDESVDNTDALHQPPEIIFDEHGQTWDVYGAEFDPEILGEAIQRHLERMMEQLDIKKRDTAENSHTYISPPVSSYESDTSGRARAWWRMLCPFPTLRKDPTIC